MQVLVFNPGSSSLKFQLLRIDEASTAVRIRGNFDRIGSADVKLQISAGALNAKSVDAVDSPGAATNAVLDALEGTTIDAIGFRVVHGGYKFDRATRISPAVRNEIESLKELSPLHNVSALQCIDAAMKKRSDVPAIAVFDTSFHRTLPDVARLYAIPRSFADQNHLYRYGFHGISHRYVSRRLIDQLTPGHSMRLITCHLGNGSSICAIRDGKSVDTSMGLTPLEGLVMGTRSGDIDAGLILHLVRELKMSADAIDDLLNHQSGLKGLSNRSGDVRDLEKAAREGDALSELALEVFAYRCRKYIGAYAAVLGGVDAIAFAGGIGEHSPGMRSRIVRGLEFLGIELDDAANRAANGEASIASGRVKVWMIPTDEERQIAVEVFEMR